MSDNGKAYLGDSVYANFVDGMIRLTTENGFGPTNEIFLEIEIFDALLMYAGRKWNVEIRVQNVRHE